MASVNHTSVNPTLNKPPLKRGTRGIKLSHEIERKGVQPLTNHHLKGVQGVYKLSHEIERKGVRPLYPYLVVVCY